MGYAMFSSREIMLVSQINDLQYRLTELTMKQQDLSQMSSAYTTQAQQYYNFTTGQMDQDALDEAINNAAPGTNVNSLQDPNGTLQNDSKLNFKLSKLSCNNYQKVKILLFRMLHLSTLSKK